MMHTELAHRNDPDTSHNAAAALSKEERSQVKAAILELLSVRPHTVPQLTQLYRNMRAIKGWPDVKLDSIAKRTSELVVAERVVDTGKRVDGLYGRPVASLGGSAVSAVERLQAAIEKLEALKAESTGPNPWIIDRDFPHMVLHPDKPGNSWDGTIVADTKRDELGLPRTPADADLIVTLHRSLPAILEVLHGALRYMQATGDEAHAVVLSLADSILGDAS